MKKILRSLSLVGLTAGLLFSGATANAVTDAARGVEPMVDCNPSFADSYTGWHQQEGNYHVKITYVDVARFFGSESGTIDITGQGGAQWKNWNGSPSGDTIPITYHESVWGTWQANLYHANGGALCAQKFMVYNLIEG